MPKNKRAQWTPEHFGEDVRAILNVTLRQVKILERDVPGNDQKQIILVINPMTKGMDLSNFTIEELDMFQKIFNDAIEMARPICQIIDERTAAAAAVNDIRYRRIWRAAPVYIEIPRKEKSDATESADNSAVPDEPHIEGNE